MDLANIVGYLATACSTISFAPQAWKIIKTRDTGAISRRMYVVTVTGFCLWTVYGVLLMQWPLIITNSVCLVLSGFILTMKLLPRDKREEVAAALDPESS